MDKEKLFERGQKVDANIGMDGGEDCWVQCIIVAIHSHTVTVREDNSDSEWTLPFGKVTARKEA